MTRPTPRLAALAATGAATCLVLAGCAGGTTAADAPTGTLSVVASTDVWGSVAQAVAFGLGDRVRVSSIVSDPGADPHSYEASPSDAAAVADADLVVVNGGGYDPYVTDVLSSTGSGEKAVVTATDVHAATGTEPTDDNEHVFYDVATVNGVAARIAEELGRLDPADAGTFTANVARFTEGSKQVAATTERIRSQRSGTQVAQTEPVAHYLLDAAGVVDATPTDFLRAVEDETDPPAAAVAATTDLLSAKRVAALVDNTQTESPVTERVRSAAQSAGVPVVGVTETLPAGTAGWVAWMKSQVDALATALGVDVSTQP
ncbi:zinc ABC transporter substrate-binding protein [Rhodococcus aerolatus]